MTSTTGLQALRSQPSSAFGRPYRKLFFVVPAHFSCGTRAIFFICDANIVGVCVIQGTLGTPFRSANHAESSLLWVDLWLLLHSFGTISRDSVHKIESHSCGFFSLSPTRAHEERGATANKQTNAAGACSCWCPVQSHGPSRIKMLMRRVKMRVDVRDVSRF